MNEDTVVKLNTGLIYRIMNENFYGVEREDLFQAGAQGVMDAFKKYKVNGTTKFSTYAFTFIFGEMYRLATQKKIKVSKDLLKRHQLIENTRYVLAQKENRIVSNEEIAEYLGKSNSWVYQGIQAGSIIVSSLDNGNDDDRSIYETIPAEETISLDDRIDIYDSLEMLNDDEKEIIKYRYFHDLTQSEVARKLKKTQAMVSRYEKRSLDKIREYMS